ncbi:MAG: hypothetical protein U0935_18980 [Pirellulales bacterium]
MPQRTDRAPAGAGAADAGVLEVERQVFDLGETVEECGELLRPLARQRGVDLHVTAHPAEISGDPWLVAQVVINLVTNAIQYNREGGRVDVTVTARAVRCDAHRPIRESAFRQRPAHLFERFYRVDKGGGRGNRAGPAWDWRLRRVSSRSIAERSTWKAKRERGRRSACDFPERARRFTGGQSGADILSRTTWAQSQRKWATMSAESRSRCRAFRERRWFPELRADPPKRLPQRG